MPRVEIGQSITMEELNRPYVKHPPVGGSISMEQLSQMEEVSAIASAAKKAPVGMSAAFKAGLLQRDFQPQGFGEKAAGFVGEILPPAAGAIFGAPGGPAGMAIGAAAAESVRQTVRAGMGEDVSPLEAIGKPTKEAALQYTGAKYVAPAISTAAKWVGREILSPVIAKVSNVTTNAISRVVKETDEVMKYIGISPDDLAKRGKSVQDILGGAKGKAEAFMRAQFRTQYEKVSAAYDDLASAADDIESKVVEAGQTLQGQIKNLYSRAGEEYSASIAAIRNKYMLDPGAAYPYTIDIHKATLGPIAKIRDKFNYGAVDLPKSAQSEQEVFNYFADRVSKMGGANIDEAINIQKHLTQTIQKYTAADGSRQPIAAALSELKGAVVKAVNAGAPEIAPMNRAYAETIRMADDLSQFMRADVASKQVYNAFKAGGNKKDALMKLAGADPDAAESIKVIVEGTDMAKDLALKMKDTEKLVKFFADLSETYTLGTAQAKLTTLAAKDKGLAKILQASAPDEEAFASVSSIMSSDNPTKMIVKIMEEGGRAKESLLQLSEKSPMLREAIEEAQRAVYGAMFSPWVSPGSGVLPGIGARPVGWAISAASKAAGPAGRVATPVAAAAASAAMPDVESGLSPDEIKSLYKSGKMSKEEAVQMLREKHGFQ